MPDSTILKCTRRNLLMLAEKSVGSDLFRNSYVIKTPATQEVDVLEDGNLSCAIFVSTLLVMVGLITRPHYAVTSVLADMEVSGWHPVDEPRPGGIVTWAKDSQYPAHIGIILEDTTTCVNNSSSMRTPQKAGLVMADGRQPEAFYWHPALELPAGTLR